jgi:phosphoglycerate dehydrogenase-like enzyme
VKKHQLLVLSDPADPRMAKLDRICDQAQLTIGNFPAAFQRSANLAAIILNWSASVEVFSQVFNLCPNVKWVHTRSAGLDKSLFPELVASPVPLTNGTGVFSPSLGEFAVAAMLYFSKDLRRMIRNQMAGIWEPFDVELVQHRTVGVVGYGDIGRAVAVRAHALGMNILALKRHASTVATDELVSRFFTTDQLNDMLSMCDYVVVAAPLTQQTLGMIGELQFAVMKSTAVIINLGRGPIINESALLQALSKNRIRGAALDVFDVEPLPQGHPFYFTEKVLLSPHCADHTSDWLDNAMDFFLEQFERYRNGQPLLNVVDKKLGY